MWIKQSSLLLSHFECADLKNISKSIKKEKDSGITYAKEDKRNPYIHDSIMGEVNCTPYV